MRETRAKDLWKKLKDKFMTPRDNIYPKNKLFRFQYRSGITMSEHLSDYNKIYADLLNLDMLILDEDKALL